MLKNGQKVEMAYGFVMGLTDLHFRMESLK